MSAPIPTHQDPRFERACSLYRSGQLSAAQPVLAEILRYQPQHAGALYHLGLIAARTRNPAAAADLFGRAAQADPHNAKAHYCEGLALQGLGQSNRALASYDRAIAVKPDYAEAYFGRANVLRELGRPDAALPDYDQAIALKPDYAEACCNRAIALRDLHQLDAALESLRAAVTIKADFAPVYLNLGNVLSELGQWDAAVSSYDRAIAIQPDYAEAYCNRAFGLLLRGQFASGWRDHEWRWKNPRSPSCHEQRSWRQPLWLAEESVAGKTVLLHSEQGLGDTIQFCRYAQRVAELGARVILEVQPPLRGLLSQLPGVAELVARGSPLPDFDCHCPLMSLPLAFRTDLRSVPWTGSYLRGDATKVSHWLARLGAKRAPRIGLVWSGSASKWNDLHRDIPLAQWLPHLPPGLQYISLQKEVRETDREALRSSPILDTSEHLLDFTDTAALCECMDLVLSVDTSVAHLSGALGKPTWILLSFMPAWRWLLDRDDSPWYPTVTLYRQARPGEWHGVFERVAVDLARR